MLSETEELLQSIPLTDHARYCQYPCYCMVGTEAELTYQENLRKRMTTGQMGHGQYYPLAKDAQVEGMNLPPECTGVTIIPVKKKRHRRTRRR